MVWPNTDLKLSNPYDFPVAIHYVVANGEAKVEILGKKRPFDKVVFARKVIEETPYNTEERLDEEMPDGLTIARSGRLRRLQADALPAVLQRQEAGREQKWTVNYKPVTEYIRRGTNNDPDAVPRRRR